MEEHTQRLSTTLSRIIIDTWEERGQCAQKSRTVPLSQATNNHSQRSQQVRTHLEATYYMYPASSLRTTAAPLRRQAQPLRKRPATMPRVATAP